MNGLSLLRAQLWQNRLHLLLVQTGEIALLFLWMRVGADLNFFGADSNTLELFVDFDLLFKGCQVGAEFAGVLLALSVQSDTRELLRNLPKKWCYESV